MDEPNDTQPVQGTPAPSVTQATEAVLADLERAAEALRRAQDSLRKK
jgi:hypothetical protein